MIFNYFETDKDVIEFDTLSGKLTVTRQKNLYEMDFPTYEQEEISVTDCKINRNIINCFQELP